MPLLLTNHSLVFVHTDRSFIFLHFLTTCQMHFVKVSFWQYRLLPVTQLAAAVNVALHPSDSCQTCMLPLAIIVCRKRNVRCSGQTPPSPPPPCATTINGRAKCSKVDTINCRKSFRASLAYEMLGKTELCRIVLLIDPWLVSKH